MIQCVFFKSPAVGGHQQPLQAYHQGEWLRSKGRVRNGWSTWKLLLATTFFFGGFTSLPSLKLTVCTWKWMVGMLVSLKRWPIGSGTNCEFCGGQSPESLTWNPRKLVVCRWCSLDQGGIFRFHVEQEETNMERTLKIWMKYKKEL